MRLNKTRVNTPLAVGLAVAGLFAVGCGAGTSATSTSAPAPAPSTSSTSTDTTALDPCSLATVSEVSTILEASVASAIRSDDGEICTYQAGDVAAVIGVLPSIAEYDRIKATFAATDAVPVGDEAFVDDSDSDPTLYVLAAGKALSFLITGPISDPGPRQLTLAQAALEHLPAQPS